MRLLIPVLPFYFCYCVLGVRWIDAAATRLGLPSAIRARNARGSLKTLPRSHFTGVMVFTLSRSIEYSPRSVLPVSFMRPWRSSAAGSFF